MALALEVLSVVVLLFWLAVALDVRRWWPRSLCLRRRPRGSAPEPPGEPDIYAVIPARNEATTLCQTLPALLSQADALAGIIAVDDRSSDGTRGVIRQAAENSPHGDKLHVVEAGPLPGDWSGKLHALQTGVGKVESLGGRGLPCPEWLLLTDADILHPSDSIRALKAKAAEGPFDLVSVMVRLRCETFWEKLLIPPFVYFFQLMYPFRRVEDPRSRVAAAAGGCILLRRSTLEGVGGLAAIRSAVIDDVTLAARVKRAGGKCWLGLDPRMLSVRAYQKFSDIAGMVARTAFCQLGYRYSLVLFTLAFLGLFFVAPPLLAVLSIVAVSPLGATLSLATWGLQSATLLPAVRHQKVRTVFALTLPVASALYGYMTALSAWRHFTGAGVSWRGRVLTGESPSKE